MESTFAELTYPARTLLNFYIYFWVVVYFWSFLTPKPNVSSRKAFLMTVLVFVLCMPMSLALYAHLALKIILAILVPVVLLGFVYRDSLFRRVIVSVFYMVLMMLAEALIAAVIVMVLGISMPMMASDEAVIAWTIPWMAISYTLCYGVPSFIARRRSGAGQTIPLGKFIILPISQVIMMGAFLYTLYISERAMGRGDALLTMIMIIACVATDIIFLHVMNSLVEKKQLEEQQALQKRHYNAMLAQQNQIRMLRHDIGNHLMTASVLAREDAAQAETYLQTLTEEFRAMTAIDYCGNPVADAVLYGKAAEAAAAGIAFSVSASLSEEIQIQELDLMSLLSNLLDNALEAAGRAENPQVEVTIREKAGTVLVQVRNSLAEDASPDLSRTTKTDGGLHGFGNRIITGICRKYEGSFAYRMEDGMFVADAMLLNMNPGGKN